MPSPGRPPADDLRAAVILVLDNRDSFVHNLARYVRLGGEPTEVVRSTAITVREGLAKAPLGVVLSPGPKRPEDAGVCVDLIRAAPQLPIYGVCLGHQCLADAYGGRTVRSGDPTHGRASTLTHDGDAMFAGVPSPFAVGRYHSLTVEVPSAGMRVTARTTGGEIMAVRHERHPHFGVQFHPESLLTTHGQQMIDNFVALCRSRTPNTTGRTVGS